VGGIGAPVKTLADWKGLSIQSISKTTINYDEAFGAAPIGVGVGDLYENFSKGVCKAAMIDANLYSETKLYEVMDYLNTYNFNSAIAFVVMNSDKYDSLPADLQELLDSKFDDFSIAMAQATNDYFINFVENTLPEAGIEVYHFDDSMNAEILRIQKEVIIDPWLATVAEEGKHDGQKIIDAFARYVSEGSEKYGEDYDWFRSIK
jgi:TRAP-type C4-dicarboxylate transport system substrate-binding protein